MDGGVVLLDGGNEAFCRRVGPQIDDLEPGTLGEHGDEVLADVVEVALDGAHDDDLCGRLIYIASDQ